MRRWALALLSSALTVIAAAPVRAAAIPEKIYVQLWPEYSNTQVLIVQSMDLPPDTPLPVEIRMAIPKDADVQWTGEILGGPTSQDIQARPRINLKDEYSEVVFTLAKSRRAQLEAVWPKLAISGKQRSIDFVWTQRFEAKSIVFGFKAPSQSTNVKMNPSISSQESTPDGLKIFWAAPLQLAPGQKQPFMITYDRNATGPSVNAGQLQDSALGTGDQPVKQGQATDTMMYAAIIAAIGGLTVAYHVYNRRQAYR